MLFRGGGAIAGLVIAVLAYHTVYGAPRDERIGDLEALTASIASLEKEIEEGGGVAARLRDAGRAMLGRKEDLVADRFRNGLGKIAEECGLVAIRDDTGSPKWLQNPVATVTKAPSNLRKSLKKAADFGVLGGYVEGVGTLENILRTLAVVQAQPWVHRVDGFSISLAGPAREHFKIRIDVATLLAPDLAPTQEGDPPIAVPPVGAEGVWRAFAARNPFKQPAPPVIATAAPSPAPTPTAPPAPAAPNPYADWKLSAVVAGGRGTEAWLVNPVTRQSRVLVVGSSFVDAVFVEGARERAVFELRGEKYELMIGDAFTSRRLVR